MQIHQGHYYRDRAKAAHVANLATKAPAHNPGTGSGWSRAGVSANPWYLETRKPYWVAKGEGLEREGQHAEAAKHWRNQFAELTALRGKLERRMAEAAIGGSYAQADYIARCLGNAKALLPALERRVARNA